MPNWPYKRINSSSCGFSYSLRPYSRLCCSLTALVAPPKCQTDPTKESIPPLGASPTLLRPLLPLCCSLSAFAAPPKCQMTCTKEPTSPLAALLLSHSHYSRFCCSPTAFAAPPKCQTDLTKELIPPLAASPTLSQPLLPLLLLSYSLRCSF